MLFSQRKGHKAVRSVIQKEEIDGALRYGLWNALHVCIWERYESYSVMYPSLRESNYWELFQRYWHGYFKYPLDNLPHNFTDALKFIRQYFFECEWFEVYDFIEFTAKSAPEQLICDFELLCNQIMKDELSAYRIVDHNIVEITSDEEINSIETAIDDTSKFKGIQTHLRSAIALLSDRQAPDFRNSIKESISAVESLSQVITGDNKTSLGAALKVIEGKINMHSALKKSFTSLYGYTSDADGIRHALLSESNLTFVDAKYMLVVCSAFVNYLIGKAAEYEIDLY